jgi:hypothetical protein
MAPGIIVAAGWLWQTGKLNRKTDLKNIGGMFPGGLSINVYPPNYPENEIFAKCLYNLTGPNEENKEANTHPARKIRIMREDIR